MQKKLIALAIAGFASTAAMAQVTVYGRLDTSYINTETDATVAGVTTTTKATSSGFGAGALTTSRLGFKASEDLGMGLTAKANLELAIVNTAALGTDTGADAPNSFVTRLANVGIAGSFGEVTLGRQGTLVEQAWAGGSVGGQNNAIGSAYSDGIKFNNTRSSNLITYASPVMSGLKFGVQYATGETDTAGSVNEHTETGLVLTYTAGALNVNVGYSKEELTAANVVTSEPEQLVVSGSYDFGVVKAYALYADGEDTPAGKNSREAVEVGVKVPLGKITLLGSVYQGETDNVAVGTADQDLAGFQLGALYSFSKRTTAYVLIGSNEVENNTGNTTTEKDQYAIGLRHDF